jgi:tol-pal system protein YbgF
MRSVKKSAALIAVMTAICLGIFVSCIATKRDVADLRAQHEQITQQNRETQRAVARMDSVMAAGADADRKLRNDLQVSISDLQQQISRLLQNYGDLMQRLDRMGETRVTSKPSSSPGAQDTSGVKDTSTVPGSKDCDSMYDAAFELMHNSQYDKAIAGYQGFLKDCPASRNVPDAHYWTGECLFSLEKYQDALDTLKAFLTSDSSSVHGRQALYKVGRCHQELKHKTDAKKIFQRVIKEYPDTKEAENARDRLKDLK